MDIWANYLGTSASASQRDNTIRMCIRLDDHGVGLYTKKKSGGYSWDDVRRLSFDDPGRTKGSVAAIALFGLAGLASRRSFTLITVTTTNEELYFDQDEPVGSWRAMSRRLVEEVPAANGRTYVDGELVGSSATPLPVGPTAPGWYPDPLGIPQLRWHDGSSWTDHTSTLPAAPQ